MATDLVFAASLTRSRDLVFGDDGGPPILPASGLSVSGTLEGVTGGTVSLAYDNAVSRPFGPTLSAPNQAAA